MSSSPDPSILVKVVRDRDPEALCPICNAPFNKPQDLSNHILQNCGDVVNTPEYPIAALSQDFPSTESSLVVGLLLVSKDSKFVCPYDGRPYSRVGNAFNHVFICRNRLTYRPDPAAWSQNPILDFSCMDPNSPGMSQIEALNFGNSLAPIQPYQDDLTAPWGGGYGNIAQQTPQQSTTLSYTEPFPMAADIFSTTSSAPFVNSDMNNQLEDHIAGTSQHFTDLGINAVGILDNSAGTELYQYGGNTLSYSGRFRTAESQHPWIWDESS